MTVTDEQLKAAKEDVSQRLYKAASAAIAAATHYAMYDTTKALEEAEKATELLISAIATTKLLRFIEED